MQYRTVAENPSFEEDLDALKGEYPYIYDVKDAVCWELCRRPRAYDLLPDETSIRIYKFNSEKTPTFRVVYKFDEGEDPRVFLLSISVIDWTAE